MQPWNNAAINARTNGYVRNWLVDIGDHVHTGEPLAVLDAPEVDQALAQAVADYQTALANQHLAATTATRWTQLLTQDAVSKQETDEKQGDLAAKSALANSALADGSSELSTSKTVSMPWPQSDSRHASVFDAPR